MVMKRNITFVLVLVALAGLLVAKGSALAGSQWGDCPSPAPGAPWAPPKGKAQVEDSGPTGWERGEGAPWSGKKPGQGMAKVDNPGPTDWEPGQGAPWGGSNPGQGKG